MRLAVCALDPMFSVASVENSDNGLLTRKRSAVADSGFPRGDANPRGRGWSANLLFDQFFPKTAWKWRNFGPEEGASLATPRSATDQTRSSLQWRMTVCHFAPVSISHQIPLVIFLSFPSMYLCWGTPTVEEGRWCQRWGLPTLDGGVTPAYDFTRF